MSRVIEKTYNGFIKKKDVASFIKFFSVLTWEKIGFVRRQRRLKFHEVTVTQNLLFQFRILSEAFPTTVEMFEAIDEKTNGNDIELFIKTREGYVFFACQAKIAHKSKTGIYTSIEHPTGPKAKKIRQQIESLIDYAEDAPAIKTGLKKGIPIYLFYNYSDDVNTLSAVQSTTTDDVEVYGCSYVDARELVGATYYNSPHWIRKPSFTLLHPKMGKPFYTLFNYLGKPQADLLRSFLSPSDSVKANSESGISDLAVYQRPQLDNRDSDYWVPIRTALANEQLTNSTQVRVANEEQGPEFNPKYRIVFGDSTIDASIIKWLFM